MGLLRLVCAGLLLAASGDGPPPRIALDEGAARVLRGKTAGFAPLVLTPDGRYALTADEGQAVVLWDLRAGAAARRFEGHAATVWSLALSRDGCFALSGGWDKTLRLWHVPSGELVRTIQGGGSEIFSVAFSSDGGRALSGDRDGRVRLWDLATGALVREFVGERNTVLSAEFAPDGARAVTAGMDNRVYLWDVASGKLLRTFDQPGHWTINHTLTPNGRFALLAGRALRLVDLESGRVVRTFAQALPNHADMPVAFAPDGRHFLVEAGSFELNLWATDTGRLVRTYVARRSMAAAAFTADGRTIVASISTPKKPGWVMAWPVFGSGREASARAPSEGGKPEGAGSSAEAALGKLLFFDKKTSGDGLVSCATCHDPRQGWSDGRPVSIGVGGRKGRRNAQSVLNAAFHKPLLWDGRAATLEDQVRMPFGDPNEMGISLAAAARKLAAIAGYRPYFKAAFGGEAVTPDRIARAIAAFERTLVSFDSPYDRSLAGDAAALSPEAARGLEIFKGKAHCFTCHQLSSRRDADAEYVNLGIPPSGPHPDLGRYEVTKKESDRGSFLVPDLRNLRTTAPYMHDGSFDTLEEVVEFYGKGGGSGPNKTFEVTPLQLTKAEKADLIKFLDALNGSPLIVDAPKLPDL